MHQEFLSLYNPHLTGSPTGSPIRSPSLSSSSSIRSTSSDAGILPNSFDIHFDVFRSGPSPSPSPSPSTGAKPDPTVKAKTVSWRLHDPAAKGFDPKSTENLFEKKPIESIAAKMKEKGQVI